MKHKVMIHSLPTRVFHWMFAASVILLIISGFYIHWPVNLGDVYDMGANIFIQTAVAFLAMGIFAAIIYENIVTQAYKDKVFRFRDIADMKGLLKYYFFMEKKAPAHGKYNAGQKLIYSSWAVVFVFMMLTGLALYLVNFGDIFPFPVAIQKVRFYHFLGALWFVGTVPLHIYLAVTEDPAKLQAMFTGWVKK